jgi:multidrug efflux pump subunit AcrB
MWISSGTSSACAGLRWRCSWGGLVVTYGIYARIPTGFLPVEDQGYFFAVIQLPDGASLQRTEAVAEKVRAILAAQDDVMDVIPVTGTNFLTGANQSNSAVEFALLKPWNERGATLTASSIVAAVRPKLLAMPATTKKPPPSSGLRASPEVTQAAPCWAQSSPRFDWPTCGGLTLSLSPIYARARDSSGVSA